MKRFLAVFTGSKDSPAYRKWQAMSDDERKVQATKGQEAWGQWVAKNMKSIIEGGSPLGKTIKVDTGGLSDYRNNLSAFTIVQAESQEEAAKLFLNHPHFTIFPGDSVEVMECLPIPTK